MFPRDTVSTGPHPDISQRALASTPRSGLVVSQREREWPLTRPSPSGRGSYARRL